MPSITTWSRLEPLTSEGNLEVGYAARVHDPLWMLTRQWQVGEFQGEDAGTPIVARWRARVKPLTHYQAGPIPANTELDAPRFDANAMPMEALVERQPLHRSPTAPEVAGLRMAVESGQHFLRLLRMQVMSGDYADAIRIAHVVSPLTEGQRPLLDPESLAYADLVAGRALDARQLRAAFGDPADPDLDPAFGIVPGDRAEVAAAYRAWIAWEEGLFAEPPAEPAKQTWQPDRMEYTFSVSTRLGDDQFGERTLTARQYADGTLDWYSFDLNGEINMGTGQDEPGGIVTRTVIPAPVTFHGMPAPRFWELEDARIDLGALQPGATDLGQVLLVETITGYGNDWYVIPIDLPVGSLVMSRSLVVTDTFGVRTLLRPTGDPELRSREGFSMFSLAMPIDAGDANGVAVTNLFFLPACVQALEGPVLEEVVLMRDELANLGWAVERRLESPLEVGLETPQVPVGASDPQEEASRDILVYRLASAVPRHWVPLIPVRLDPDEPEVRLVRGAVLDLDGTPRVAEASAQILEVGQGRLLIREEEVPREGLVVRRSYQAARWHDGRLFVWAGNRVSVGRGETSSGLAFDRLET
jgi:hypothetical protein